MAFAKGRPGFVRASNVLLLIASLVFYAWGEPVTVLLLIGEALFCWLATLLIEKKPKLKKLWLAAACVAVLGALCFFKYSGFAAGIISAIFPGNTQLFAAAYDLKQIALPLGISFFSFQILSYVIDVYRGTSQHCANFFRMLLYVSFFPQLVAGPIVKYREIEEQLGAMGLKNPIEYFNDEYMPSFHFDRLEEQEANDEKARRENRKQGHRREARRNHPENHGNRLGF